MGSGTSGADLTRGQHNNGTHESSSLIVIPADPLCELSVRRLHAKGEDLNLPPFTALEQGQRLGIAGQREPAGATANSAAPPGTVTPIAFHRSHRLLWPIRQ
jgi:hypothetical protein